MRGRASAEPGLFLVALLLVACDHSAADMAAGGGSRATTECFVPAHPRAAIAADLRD